MNKIKEARLKAGLTQKSMSELMEIPKRTIENWESGVNTPPEYVERFILKELEEIRKKIEMENKDVYVVIETIYPAEGQVVFIGTKLECAEYEEEARRELTQDEKVTHDFYTENAVEMEKRREYIEALDAYGGTLTEEEKAEIITIDGRRYQKWMVDFRKEYYK